MILGNYEDPTTAKDAEDGVVVVTADLTMPTDAVLTKLSALLDGEGSGSGVQRLRGAMWSDSGSLLVVTEEIEISNGDAEGWYDLAFSEPQVWPAGEVRQIGLHFGGPTSIARWYSRDDDDGATAADAFMDGTADLSAPEGEDQPMIFATYSGNPRLPFESDLFYANLGFLSAQEKLGETEAAEPRHRMTAGWHGTFLDTEPQGASLAIVDTESPLADELIGERVRISHSTRSVVVYVHRATELDSGDVEISLSRRAFAALTLLSVEELNVRVEVLS